MVALNVTLTAINVFYIVRLATCSGTTHRTLEVVEISPSGTYLKHLLHEFEADIQHFNPGFSDDDAARAESRLPHPLRSRDGGPGAGQKTPAMDQRRSSLDYVVTRYQGFTLGRVRLQPQCPPGRARGTAD